MSAPLCNLHLYVHWPYCRRICPYCDFNVKRWRNQETHTLEKAFLADLRAEADLRHEGYRLCSIHFGGGTPSMMPPEIIAAIISEAKALFRHSSDLEIALEANPEDATLLPAIAQSGVKRLTLGAQSIRDKRLDFLGRAHSHQDVLHAVESARSLFSSLALDVIFATPAQTVDEWQQELREILSLPIDHLSLYGLTIAPNTAFGHRPPADLPCSDTEADMLLMNVAEATAQGFSHYEISNFAKPHHRSVYNLGVWKSEDYIGIGPGAHGRWCQDQSRWTLRKIPGVVEWQQAILKQHCSSPEHFLYGLESQEKLSLKAAMQEWLLLGMRLRQGLDLYTLPTFLSKKLDTESLCNTFMTHPDAQRFTQEGLWKIDNGFLSASEKGWLLLDRLCAILSEIWEQEL